MIFYLLILHWCIEFLVIIAFNVLIQVLLENRMLAENFLLLPCSEHIYNVYIYVTVILLQIFSSQVFCDINIVLYLKRTLDLTLGYYYRHLGYHYPSIVTSIVSTFCVTCCEVFQSIYLASSCMTGVLSVEKCGRGHRDIGHYTPIPVIVRDPK